MKFSEWIHDQPVSAVSAPADGGPEVSDLACDSREVGPGWAFAALRGGRADGADFVPAALAAGAVAVLADRDLEVPPGVAFARLEGGRETLALVARRLYGEPDRRLALIDPPRWPWPRR